MYLVGLLLGGLEVLLTVWLVILAVTGNLWGIAGLIAYYLLSIWIGATPLKLLLTTISAGVLAFVFIFFGFWLAVGAFIALVIIFEFIPRADDEPDEDLLA